MAERTLEETEQATSERVQHLPLDFTAAHALLSVYRAANAVRGRLTNGVLRPHDLTWTGFLVLWNLWIWEEMETREVAESVGISKGTLTGVVKTLGSRGLVDREQGSQDRRLVNLRLSAAGLTLMDEVYPEFNRAETEVVAGVDRELLASMTEALRQLVAAAESRT